MLVSKRFVADQCTDSDHLFERDAIQVSVHKAKSVYRCITKRVAHGTVSAEGIILKIYALNIFDQNGLFLVSTDINPEDKFDYTQYSSLSFYPLNLKRAV